VNKRQDLHCEYASIGAGHAASVLARLFDCTVLMQPPRCYQIETGHLPESMVYQQEWKAAIFTDFSGALSGQAGIMISESVVLEIVSRLLGEDPGGEISPRGRSALQEVGNIALSAAAGALGDLRGGIVWPSVPRLGFSLTEALRLAKLGPGGDLLPAFLAETELVERDGSLRLRFIWIPGE